MRKELLHKMKRLISINTIKSNSLFGGRCFLSPVLWLPSLAPHGEMVGERGRKGGGRGRLLLLLLCIFFCSSRIYADTWDGSQASQFASGSGTKSDPYIISNAAELAYFGSIYDGKTAYYKITSDMNLNGREWAYHNGKTFRGHLIGDKGNGAKPVISNYKINVPNTAGNYGLLGNVNNGEIRNICVSDVTVKYGATISSNTIVKSAALIGNAENGTLVEGCSANNITVNLVKQSVTSVYCSGLIGVLGSANSIVRNCSVKTCTLNFSSSVSNGGHYSSLVGRMEGLCTVEDCSIETIEFNTSSSLQACNLAGLVASMQGVDAIQRAVITRCSVKGITYNLGGELQNKVGIGSIVAWTQGGKTDITRCKTTGLNVIMAGNLTATNGNDIRLGGMVGKLENGGRVTDCILYGTNYIGGKAGISKTFKQGICMNVGGIVGSTVDQGISENNQIVVERCVAYCDFDFSGYTSATAGNLSKNEFVIGGVIGRLYKPYYIPTTLYFSGKVKAPYCVVGPLVGTFQSSYTANAFIYDDYSGANNSRVTAVANTDNGFKQWYYGDYQLWLTSDVINTTKTKNGDYTSVGYATIGDVSTWTANKIGSANKSSKTILRYTTNANYIDHEENLNADLTLCPNYSEGTDQFPKYYMYYAQGVNRGNYQSNINTVLAALRAGDDSPIWDEDASGNIVMDRFKATEEMKSDDAFISVLTVLNEDGTDAPSGYTYEWKHGNSSLGTGASINVARGQNPKTATLYIKKESTTIGTLTVTIPRAEWYDVGSIADQVDGKKPTGDGSTADPYKIATAEHLAWMGYHISQANARNTQHYELTADINLDGAWWTPINGVEETGAGSFGGVFDGKAYTIRNMHIDWDVNYANAANFGLFTIIEGGSSSQYAVVRNLVIDKATVSKETNVSVVGNRFVGILAGNIKPYSQIENVIVRNSVIKASATESAQNGKTLIFGGLAGKINSNGNNYIFLNISTDVDLDLSKLNVNTPANVKVGGVIGVWQTGAKTCVKNVYALGSITVPSGPTNVGSVFGQDFSGLTNETKATIFYVNSATQNVGTQKSLTEYASTFLETANEETKDRDELLLWVYSQSEGYDLSSIGVKVHDTDAGQTRFDTHTMVIQEMSTGLYTYEWFLNNVSVGTGTTYEAKPIVPGDNSTLVVKVSKSGEGVVATLPVPIPTGIFYGTGTSADPYLIGCKEELLLLSYLSNQIGSYEYNSKTTTDYNQAYYELDNNVVWTGVTDFTPIGSVKDNYQSTNCFSGHFDGKGYTIEGLTIGWEAGDVDAERNRVWGLFGAVQGISTSQKAVIQNLVIKNAVLTHKTTNTSFYYDNGTSGNANNCYVGVLAGVVGAFTTIQNIEVSGCSITDYGSPAYKIADHTLSVGGVIGRAQYSFSSDGDLNSSTIIRLISSDCDITINHASFTSENEANEYKINVAGIVGSMESTGASGTMPWPSCTYYTGQVTAVAKAMVSPVFSCAEFRNNTTYDYGHYCNLYVGKITSSDISPINDAFYGSGYKIYYNGDYQSITDSYPANTCDMGARTLVAHSASSYADYSYQGVNYGTYASNEADVVSAFSDGRNNASNNSEIVSFGFSFEGGKLKLGEVFDIEITDNHEGDASELIHTLTVTNRLNATGLTYKWCINEVESGTGDAKEITIGVTPQLVCVKVYRGDDLKYTTNVIDLPRGYTFTADYEPKYSFSGTYTVTPNANFTSGGYTYDYDWKEWNEGTTTTRPYTAQECLDINRPYIVSVKHNSTIVPPENWTSAIYDGTPGYTVTYTEGYTAISTLDNYTTSTAGKVNLASGTTATTTTTGCQLTGAVETKTYYCTITAKDAAWNTFVTANVSNPMYSGLVAKYLTQFEIELTVKYIKTNVVYLHTNDVETINGVSYPSGADSNDGKTDQSPVRTWQKAYSLLRDNADWDENYIVLIGTSSRDVTCGATGFSITTNLRSNGKTEPYATWKSLVDASHLAKATTITGKFDGVDYNGVIEAYGSASARYIGLFGDTRFQNITFSHPTSSSSQHSIYLFCQYNNLEMGEGIQMIGFNPSHTPGYCGIDGAKVISLQIYGGFNNDARFHRDYKTLYKTEEDCGNKYESLEAMDAAMPHGKKGFSITLKSGRYSSVCVGGRQAGDKLNGLMGTPNLPIKCTVTVDIDRAWNNAHNEKNADYDCGVIQAACQEGAMYADVDIIIKSGYVARVVNGTLGNKIKNYQGSSSCPFPANTYVGRANILIDPRDADGNIDNKKVVITEFYGGSTGRGYDSSNGLYTIDNPIYGKSTVTINGGTFKILPDGNPNKNNIFCGVFGAGAGGYSGIGEGDHITPDEHIAYWGKDGSGKDLILFGNYDTAKNNLVTCKCYNADGSEIIIDPRETSTEIVINGGDFGTSTAPIDGVYAGGSGYMSPGLFSSTYVKPSRYGGNVYGRADATVSSLTINGGTFWCEHGIFAGGRGTDRFYSENAYQGTPSDYTELAKTYGNVELNINGGDFHCNVYGGGAGAAEAKLKNSDTYGQLTDMARLTGNSVINIGSKDGKSAHIYGNVYGGGMLAGVTGSTTVNISGNAVIDGDVFGAAQGITNDVTNTTLRGTLASYTLHTSGNADKFGKVSGNATIKTAGNPTIHGDVYGGAESGITEGSTSITLNGATLGGNVYGGGLGALKNNDVIASADVNGNTYVRIDKANYSSPTADYYVYGGGNNACNIGGSTGGKTEVVINGCTTTDQMTVYGGGYGENTSVKNTYITVNDFETESNNTNYGLSSIYGGGNAGHVTGKTNIALNGGQIFGDVFGGGNVANVGTEYPTEGSEEEKAQYLNIYASQYGTELSMQGVGPIIYGNIYGGGNKANVFGNTSVSVSNGSFAGEIFGGGNGDITTNPITSANVIGATNVYVSGTTVIWNKKWKHASKTLVEWDGTWNDVNLGQFMSGSSENPVFLDNHNVYGGGNLACRVLSIDGASNSGVATVELTKGFCGFDLLSTDVWKRAYSDNNNPHFSVFGGGYGAYTSVGSTVVRISVDDYSALSGATTDQQLAKSQGLEVEGQRSKVKGQRSKARRNAESEQTTIGVYDDSYGVPGQTVHSVIGGGYAGIVEHNTDVTVGGNTFMHRVFGGGYGQLAAYSNLTAEADIAVGLATSKTRENLGEVGGNATVVANGGYIYGDIFGGGAGVESATIGSTLTDFKDMGRVKGTTSVTVSGDAQVFGSVYGGGDVANVGIEGSVKNYGNVPESHSTFDENLDVTAYTHSNATSFVNIIGGDIFGQVFAGGNGRKKSETADYTKLGRIEGNTLVHVADGTNVPFIWNRIFGGCSYGTVDGNALVHIEGGMLGGSIFGGGKGDAADDTPAPVGGSASLTTGSYADIKGNTNVTIDGGTWLWNQMADEHGDITVWKGATYVVAGSLAEIRAMSIAERSMLAAKYLDRRFVDADDDGNPHFVNAHNIFGGGMDACVVGSDGVANTGTATVTINHSPLGRFKDENGDVVNMLDEKTVGGLCWYACISNVENPQFSIFGGGWGMNTRVRETKVYAGPGVRYDATGAGLIPLADGGKPTYAYQKRDRAEYEAFEASLFDDYKYVTEDEKIKMYGSSDGTDNDVRTFLRYRASRLAMSLGAPSFTFMNIHGGGFSGYVTGDARVVTDGQLACRNVFGGGLGSHPTTPTGNETYGEVGGNASVSLLSGIVSLNVFGGGAGVASLDKDKDGVLTDFPYIARVKGKTEVEVYGEAISEDSDVPNLNGEGYQKYNKERVLVFGSVYGGGDVACVGEEPDTPKAAEVLTTSSTDFTTSVSVYGASILSAVYAGGNGRVKAKCNDYTKLGAVYGNTRLFVEATKKAYPYTKGYSGNTTVTFPYTRNDGTLTTPLTVAVIPYLWNRVYGGCQNGVVYGNTLLDLEGGYFAYNIFGGGWGNVDSLEVNGVMTADPDKITSADVRGNTNIYVHGGEAKVTSLWNPDTRTWTPAPVINRNGDITLYSPQYDPSMKKFTVNHNIYGGGRTACVVGNNTYVTMKKGMLLKKHETVSAVSTEEIGGFFNTNEWQEIYHKVGSPHFCILGGGYGENTVVNHNTNILVDMPAQEVAIEDADIIIDKDLLHQHFYSGQSLMDVIGGGYSGIVRGSTNITIGGNTFLRRVFGGGFFAPVGSANININRIDCNDIFGGGLMGDVGFTDASQYDDALAEADRGVVTLNIGTNSEAGETRGNAIYVHNNIYGGNDVSGDILGKTILNLGAGHVLGNVYGAGNGDYLYAVGRNKEKQVTVNEYYKMGKNTYDLVYTVPLRKFMPSIAASTPAQRMVNCSSYRPKVQTVEIHLSGPSNDYPLELGGVFGGGNSATVSNITGTAPAVTFNFGSNLKIKNVFMGCDGDAMFDGSEKYRKAYEDLNSLHLEDEIDWVNNPGNHAITQQYLPVSHDNRPKVYQHLLDLYFQPVEMDVQPTVNWASDMTNVTIGSFYCGGNRGNMNVEPANDGHIVDYDFPASLVITDKIVGGCNAANYMMPNSGVIHKGGYLLGVRGKNAIKLNVMCQFKPATNADGIKEGGNVYGGCYTSGTIDGDVYIDMKSDMLANVTSEQLTAAKAKDIALCSVYGAGYGSLAYVRGNTRIDFGKGIPNDKFASSLFDGSSPHGVTANFIYGGGQQGSVVGNSTVRVYNGHVASSVCGASYAGLMWGSTHILVGYPKYYTVQKGGTYNLQRTDKWNATILNSDNSEVVKQSIKLLEGDIISEEVFDAIWAYDAEHTQATTGAGGNFSAIVTTAPTDSESSLTWDKIDIKIDEAVYGGGYVLSSGSSLSAGTYTLKKFNDEENLDEFLSAEKLSALDANSTKGYGGNTTLLVWDAPTGLAGSTDHISVSLQTMKEKTGLADTDNIFGYYYKDSFGNYRYIYKEDNGKEGDNKKVYTITYPNSYSGLDHDDPLYDPFFADAVRDANGKIIVYEPNTEGGMYGDGRLSFAEGFRSGELYGYGFAGKTPEHARIVNSFQRMDMLRLTDCAVMLLGARDYNVSEISATPYSIARVGEIQMIAQNVTNLASGTLSSASVSRSRNYLGLSNNIHYCGALYSNVKFTDDYHKIDGSVEAAGTTSYLSKKQLYITNRNITDESVSPNATNFQERNGGTAANMIGIASGYALKIQNVQSVGSSEEKIFYGPAVGIFEVALVNVREDEGGGYVYAKNIHTRKASTAKQLAPRKKTLSTDAPEVTGTEDFLQTSGNFVFQNDANRYIIDDCFSHGYDKQASLPENGKDDVHYWYVTNRHYYYNTTITGYTYNSTATPLKFNSDNQDALMNLVGTPAGSRVRLKKVTWRCAHSSAYNSDIENTDKNYKLSIGASSSTSYDKKGVYFTDIPRSGETSYSGETGYFTGETDIAVANIALQLTDAVDNSGSVYFREHMSEPCQVTIDLETTVGTGVFVNDVEETTTYTYTIYLTINYVQGPDATGTVKVENCALPGEMIEINKGTIKVESDQSIAQCATIYRIGPREKGADGKWHFKKDANNNEIFYTYEVGYPYQEEKGSGNATSEMLAGVVYDESNTTNPCIRVPAYYFMNGYGVQYCFRVYGLNETFLVPMDDNSELIIHNYHRMEPRRSGGGIYEGSQALDLHIDLAAERARNEGTSEPRIYIEDAIDLNRFATFLNEKTDETSDVGTKNKFGANMQFFMQDDVTIGSDYVAPENFKGKFHGDGHVITGLERTKGLFKAVDATANIYNLGLASGKIVTGSNSEDNARLHCCYEYTQNTVYRMNGNAVKGYMDGAIFRGYSKDDWRYGKVAYDLNQYYLDKRYVVDGEGSTADAQNYVENYYANGDYLYAGYSSDNHFEGSEFIRDAYLPNYGYAVTAHNTAHPIDESRAVKDNVGKLTGYQPLFNANNVEGGKPKNDYLFFGQVLNADTKDNAAGTPGLTIPSAITLDEEGDGYNLTEGMFNRVYRAGGYYGSKYNHGFYYNSDAYVHDNGITAIDFYGYGSQSYDNELEAGGNISSASGVGMDYYSPLSDYGMGSIGVGAGVTRNLLIYARSAGDRTGVLADFNYIDSDDGRHGTSESDIKAHVIDQAATPTTGYLHLVERTADGKDSEGGDCVNNDFNCPIAFNVTNRAWYTRVPRYYAANSNDAWEGVSLPFSVNRVEATYNGEISHFYGTDEPTHAANETTNKNITNAGHEYWLRGLTASTPAVNTDPVKATFTRPGSIDDGLFAGGTLTGDYSYSNSHFADVYGAIYRDGGMSIYNTTRNFAGYYFQQSYVPYIVSFPGEAFMEFDLSGEYNQALTLGDHGVWDADNDTHSFSFREEAMKPQNVTFSWYCVNGNVTNAVGAISVGVTDDAATSTTAGTVKHCAAFSAQSDDDTYAMNGYGTAFDSNNKSVLPFRTYMKLASSSAKAFAKPKSILIYENGGIEELPQADDADTDGLRIWSKNRKIYVESPVSMSLSLYTSTGQLVRIFDVVPGTNTYSGFANGIYIIGKKKLYVK